MSSQQRQIRTFSSQCKPVVQDLSLEGREFVMSAAEYGIHGSKSKGFTAFLDCAKSGELFMKRFNICNTKVRELRWDVSDGRFMPAVRYDVFCWRMS